MNKGKMCLFIVGILLLMSMNTMAFPSSSITYIIPFDAGGQSDLEARRQQPLLEEYLGQSVLIQYKPGGGGSLGWSELVASPAHGHIMCGINIPHIILQPLVRPDAGYKTESIIPVALFQATPIGLAVTKDSTWQTLEEFLAYARKNPGRITIGGSGTYSGHHLAHLQLEDLADVKLSYVPYTGAAPQMAAFLGGHVQAIFGNSNDLVLHEDKIRILAFGSQEPFPLLPHVPTFVQLGFDMLPSIDRGVGLPPNTPEERVAILEEAFLRIMDNPEIREQMIDQGFIPLQMGRADAEKYIQTKQLQYEAILMELELIK